MNTLKFLKKKINLNHYQFLFLINSFKNKIFNTFNPFFLNVNFLPSFKKNYITKKVFLNSLILIPTNVKFFKKRKFNLFNFLDIEVIKPKIITHMKKYNAYLIAFLNEFTFILNFGEKKDYFLRDVKHNSIIRVPSEEFFLEENKSSLKHQLKNTLYKKFFKKRRRLLENDDSFYLCNDQFFVVTKEKKVKNEFLNIKMKKHFSKKKFFVSRFFKK